MSLEAAREPSISAPPYGLNEELHLERAEVRGTPLTPVVATTSLVSEVSHRALTQSIW